MTTTTKQPKHKNSKEEQKKIDAEVTDLITQGNTCAKIMAHLRDKYKYSKEGSRKIVQKCHEILSENEHFIFKDRIESAVQQIEAGIQISLDNGNMKDYAKFLDLKLKLADIQVKKQLIEKEVIQPQPIVITVEGQDNESSTST